MKRVTYRTIIERQSNTEFADFPKLKDILVDLSVKNTPKVVRKLRLIGFPIEFTEFSDKKRVEDKKPLDTGKKKDYSTVRVPFPDADLNKKITRIGHEDPNQCPWKAGGYVGARKFAIRCFEEQENGDWIPKILLKGPSVFNEFATWEFGRVEENDSELSSFLGGRVAPNVRVQATFDEYKLGGVDYKVFVGSKDMPLTEDMIDKLRAIREPSADELNAIRSEYLEDQKEDPSLPDWEDFYEYGFDLKRIFKFTPPLISSESQEAISEKVDVEVDDFGGTEKEKSSSVAVLEKEDKEIEDTDDEDADGFGDINW